MESTGDNGIVDNSIAIGNEIGDNGTFIDLVNSNKPLDLKTENTEKIIRSHSGDASGNKE